jgi:hypothetical protein
MKISVCLLILCLLLVGCTHMRPIERVSTPLKIIQADVPLIDSIRLEINFLNPQKDKSKTDVESLRLSIEEAFRTNGIIPKFDSPNLLTLDVNRFMIVGDGLVFCKSVVEITARAKIAEKALKPERFIASKNGYFCAFGNSTDKMKDATKEALEEVLNNLMKWAKF